MNIMLPRFEEGPKNLYFIHYSYNVVCLINLYCHLLFQAQSLTGLLAKMTLFLLISVKRSTRRCIPNNTCILSAV